MNQTHRLEVGVNMAEQKFQKGSEQWQFFQDFWQFRQKYYKPDNEEEWFIELMNVGEEIIEKYQNTEFAKFAQSLVFSHFEDVEMRCCQKKKGENRAQSTAKD